MPESTRRRSRFFFELVAADGAWETDVPLPVLRSVQLAHCARGGTVNTARSIDSNGRLYTPGYQTPRLTFVRDPVSGLTVPGWLVEPARTNSIVQSQIASGWTKNSGTMTITQGAADGPDGISGSAVKIVEGTVVDGSNVIFQTFTATNDTLQGVSVCLKAAERTWAILRTRGKDNVNVQSWLNLATGAVGHQGVIVGGGAESTRHVLRVESLVDDWYRISTPWDPLSGGTAPFLGFGPSSADHISGYTGDGTSGIYAYGAQLEIDQPYATSYVATGAAAVTRSKDTFYVTYRGPFAEQTIWIDMIEGTPGSRFPTASRVLEIGDAFAGGGPSISVQRYPGVGTANYSCLHSNGVVGAVSSASPGQTINAGDRVRIRIVIDGTGAVTTAAQVNSAAEQVGTPSAGVAFVTPANQPRLTLGADYSGGNNGGAATYLAVRIAGGSKSAAFMQAA
jgi:hypothetical protein